MLLFSRNQYLRLFTTGKQSADKFPAPGHVQQPTRGVVRDDNQGAFNSTLSTLPLETVNMRKESRRTTLLGVCVCVWGGHHFSTFRLAQLLQVNISQDMVRIASVHYIKPTGPNGTWVMKTGFWHEVQDDNALVS